MKSRLISMLASIACTFALAAVTDSAAAQSMSPAAPSSPLHLDKSIEYHGGPVLFSIQDLYFVWYGDWSGDTSTPFILADFASNIGSTPYMQINSTYADANGKPATSTLIYGGSVYDLYSRGGKLTEADIAGIVADKITSSVLPQDPNGIYVVFVSPDVTDVDGTTQFCLTCCDLHGHSIANGSGFKYVFVGYPSRGPGICDASPNGMVTPNGNYAADQMASWLAHALNAVLTDPFDNAWFDRYGLEDSEKCQGTYGTTYTVTNPNNQSAQANVKIGTRDYLLQQNWVNGKKGHCGMTP